MIQVQLPVTRAKSPNLTRRKSCSDATKSTQEDKGVCDRAKRHSVGVYKEGSSAPSTPKSKDMTGRRSSIAGVSKEGSSTPTATKSKSTLSRRHSSEASKTKERPKQVKQTSNASRAKDQTVAGADISVVEEVTKIPTMVEHIADISVVEVTNEFPDALTDQMSTDISISEDAKKPSPAVAEQKSADIAVET